MSHRIIIVLLLLTSLSCFGQSRKHRKQEATAKPKVASWIVPAVVEQKFVVENPEAKANWKKDGPYYKAQFVSPLNNLGYVLVYDSLGHIVRRDKELESSEYPPSIPDYFIKKYPGEGYVVWSTTDSSGNFSYYSHRDSQTIRFDKDGNYQDPSVKARIVDSSLTSPERSATANPR